MAVPFYLPSDQETEDNYRRLDQLLSDLYEVLRQILLRRPITERVMAEQGRREVGGRLPRPATPPATAQRHHQCHHQHQCHHLPDIVPSSSASGAGPVVQSPALVTSRKPPLPPSRPRRRRRQEKTLVEALLLEGSLRREASFRLEQHLSSLGTSQQQSAASGPSWLNVGIELRQIAEDIKSTHVGVVAKRRRREVKASSLFSLLVPASLSGTIWTTVILIVGWRILSRHRASL